MYSSTSKGELAASKAADWWLMALVMAEMPSVQADAATSPKTAITQTLLLTTSGESATWTRPSRLKKLFEFLKTPSQALPSADHSDGSSRTASPFKPHVVNEALQTEEHKKREVVDGASPTRSENPSKKVVQPTVQQGSLQPAARGTLPRNEGPVLGQTQSHNLQGLLFPGAADRSRSVEQESHKHVSSRTDTKAVSNDDVSHVTTTLLTPALSSNSQSPSSALADSSVSISPDEMIHMRRSEPVAAVENAIITNTTSTRTHSQSFEANASSVIEVPFNLSAFEKLDKTRYMALRETISGDLAYRWATEVKPRLDEDLQKLIRTTSSGTDQILSNTRFYMVGTRHGEILRAVPTIVVSCGTKRSKNKVKKELCRLKLHYLNDFGQPIIIRYQCSPTYWAASSVEEASSTAGNLKSSALRCVWIESGPQLSSCGLKLMFEVQYDTVLERKYATLGGIVRINGRFYGLTSPHSWLANISVSNNSQTGMQDDEKTSSSSQSDSEVDDDIQRSPYGPQYLQFSPSASMNFEPFWSPSMQAPKAHSFLGQVAHIDGTVCYDSSRCDWALFTLPRTYILPNTYYDTKDGASSSVAPTEIQSVSKESELTPGSVSILSDARMPVIGFLTQTNVSFHTRDCVMDVREIALNSPLAGGASGSWVVRDDKLCGYIVAVAGTGMSGFMMPMQRAFKDIETTFGHKVKVGKDLVDFSPQVPADIVPAHQKFSEGIDIQKLTLVPPRLADFAELDSSRWLTMEKGTKTAIRDRSSSPEAQRADLPIAAAPRGTSRAQEHAPEKTEISATINTENTKLDRAIPQAKTNDVPSQPNELPWTWRRPHFAGYNPTGATEDASRKRMDSAYSKPAGGGPVVIPKNTPSPHHLATATRLGAIEEYGGMLLDIPQSSQYRPMARLFNPSQASQARARAPYTEYNDVTGPRGEKFSEAERRSSDSEKYTDVERVGNFDTTEDADVNSPEGDPADPNIVDWDPDDPEKAMNWPWKKVLGNIAIISVVTLLTPLASSMVAPGVPLILKEFKNTNETIGAFIVSIYILGYATGPLLLAPLSEMYGRLYLYHANNVLFIIWTVACALSPNVGALLVFRFFAGIAGSCPLTIGGGSIADMIRQEKRGGAMAIFALGPLFGPVIGPVAGGYLSEAEGWRWVFWVISIAGGVAACFSFIFMRETYPPVLLARKVARLRKEQNNPNLRSILESDKIPSAYFKQSIIRPTKMLFRSPIVFALSVYMAVVYGYLYLLFTTITLVFELRYGFSQGNVGLTYLGIGVGSMVGLIIFGFISDKIVKHMSAKGEMKPEYRLTPLIPGSLIIPIGLFLYGWSVEKHTHWIVPIIGTMFVGFGLLATFMPIQTYLIDAFTIHAASAIAASTVLRSLVGTFLPLAGPKLYAALGFGWGNSLLGFIAVALAPLSWIFFKYGERIRKSPRFQVHF